MSDTKFIELLKEEQKRQKKTITLIASENYCSKDVMKALGSELVNKYAEGYPGKRYYKGNATVDKIELLAQERALKLFKLSSKKWSVNVQPLSGSPANLAIYNALLKPGDKIMGLTLSQGGHLTHGHSVTMSGKNWQQVPYELDRKTERLDYEALKKIAKREKPKMIIAGFTAYPRAINWKKFREVADSCGAYLHVDMSHIAGLVAGGVHSSPFKYADTVMTTTHKTLRGPRGAMIFSRIELANKIDKAVFPGIQGGPHMNKIGALAVALHEAAQPEFKGYAAQVVVNAKVLASELASLGWRIISGGTDNHLLLVDTWKDGEGIGGKDAADCLEGVGIVTNQNTIPYDTRSPFDPSGLRLGTAAETSRGLKEDDMKKIAHKIDATLRANIK